MKKRVIIYSVIALGLILMIISGVTVLFVVLEAEKKTDEIKNSGEVPAVEWYNQAKDTVLIIQGDSIHATHDEYNSLIWFQTDNSN